jgi:hypothetical protein
VFFAILEGAVVGGAVSFLEGALVELVVFELACEFVSICVYELAVLTCFLVVAHLAGVFGAVGVGDGAVDEFAVLEVTLEDTVFLLPDTLAVGFAFG